TEKVKTQFKGLHDAGKVLADNFHAAVTPALAAFGLTSATVAGSVIGLTKNFIDYGKSLTAIKNLAPELNLNAQQLYAMTRAADQADLPGVVDSLKSFQDKMNKLAQGKEWGLAGIGLPKLQERLAVLAKSKDTLGGLRAIREEIH